MRKNKWFHILIWVMMLIYISFAPSLYTYFFLKNGKPIDLSEGRPGDSDEIHFAVDALFFQPVDGQDMYNMQGWAFSTLDKSISPDKYERIVVLTSEDNIYFFPSQPAGRPDVQQGFVDMEMDLIYSGFNAIIAKDVIFPGVYRIGIIFRDPVNGSAHYSDKPAIYLVRTANRLFLKNNKP